MNIYIDERAKEYIRKKTDHKSIVIIGAKIGAGWCAAFKPSVQMGKPSDEENFNLHRVEDINVYIPPKYKMSGDQVQVIYSKLLWMESLNISGIAME